MAPSSMTLGNLQGRSPIALSLFRYDFHYIFVKHLTTFQLI